MAERTSEYKLPDGQVVDIGKERFRCPEALFQPSLIGENRPVLEISLLIESANSEASVTCIHKVLM